MAITAPITGQKNIKKASSIEESLKKKGAISSEQLEFIRNEVNRRQESSEKIIGSMNWVSEEELAQAKAEVMGVKYDNPAEHPISPEVLALIPEEVAKRFTIIPISKEGSTISVAMVDPLDLQAVEFIEKKSGQQIRPFLATASSVTKAIAEQYTKGLASEVTAALKEVAPGVGKSYNASQKQATAVLGEAPVARIVSTLLEYGIRVRASDIHIEPLENETRVRYRIDGILQEKLILPKKIHESIISRIKI